MWTLPARLRNWLAAAEGRARIVLGTRLAVFASLVVARVLTPMMAAYLMRTKDAVSPVEPTQVALSLLAFVVVYTFLGIVDIYLHLSSFAGFQALEIAAKP